MMLRCWPLLLLGLTACGPKPGEQHLPALREALMSVDSAAARFEAADHDAALPAHARVDSTLAIVEARMQGLVVNLEQGQPFSVLDERRRMLKRQPGRGATVNTSRRATVAYSTVKRVLIHMFYVTEYENSKVVKRGAMIKMLQRAPKHRI